MFFAESGENVNAIQVSSTLSMTVGIVAIVVIVVTAVTLTLLWRRIRRAASEHSELISRANLRLRATIGPAQRRELSELRLRLLEETNQTRRTIAYAQQNGSAFGELSTLFGRIESVAEGLEAQLSTLRREPSADLVASALPQARIRVDQVAAAARSIRIQALALDGPGSTSDVELRRLVTDIDGEARRWLSGVRLTVSWQAAKRRHRIRWLRRDSIVASSPHERIPQPRRVRRRSAGAAWRGHRPPLLRRLGTAQPRQAVRDGDGRPVPPRRQYDPRRL